jgi:DNA gyrase/topoisomerase IV subunit B
MPFSRLQEAKLADCQRHGLDSGAELFVVEGDSASKSVCRARNPQTQAVLPMQGKPLNAIKASKNAVQRYELFQTLINTLGTDWDDQFDIAKLRYHRVILLFDPDADGIHCGALMLMFFHRWMRPLLESGRLCVIRPPLYEISSPHTCDKLHAYSDAEYRRLCIKLKEQGIDYQGQRYRGLASMSEVTLVQTCLDPKTRNINRLTCKDAESAIRIFVGENPKKSK